MANDAKRRALPWVLAGIAGIAIGGASATLFPRLFHHSASVAHEGELYQCPMHPTYTSDRPGDCPICGMKLVKVEHQDAGQAERRIAFYRSPMNPSETSPVPRKDSMGMDFVPVYD